MIYLLLPDELDDKTLSRQIEEIAQVQDDNKFYFPKKPCKNGHLSKRYKANRACFECRSSIDRLTEIEIKTIADSLDIQSKCILDEYTQCWIWLGNKNNKGYGVVHRANKIRYVHRLSYIKYKGNISPNMEVCHACDIPACANPEHLFLGTHAENMRDMYKKGKNGNKGGYKLEVFNGEGNPNAKLTKETILSIRELSKQGVSQRKIAKKFGIAQPTVNQIIKDLRWGHIK